MKLPLKPFTLIGATTRLSALSSPLRDRFGNILKLDFYNYDELATIVERNCSTLGFNLDSDTCRIVSQKSRGTPRIANRLLKIVRDYHTIGKDISDTKVIEEVFKSIGIDSLGLDYLDRKFLTLIADKFSG